MNENIKDIYIGNKRVKQIFRGGDLIYNRRVYLIKNGVINDFTILGSHRYNYIRDEYKIGYVTETNKSVDISMQISGNCPGDFSLEFSNKMPINTFKKINILFDIIFNKDSNTRIAFIHNLYFLNKNEPDPTPNIKIYNIDHSYTGNDISITKDIPSLRNDTYFSLLCGFYNRFGNANVLFKIKELYLE